MVGVTPVNVGEKVRIEILSLVVLPRLKRIVSRCPASARIAAWKLPLAAAVVDAEIIVAVLVIVTRLLPGTALVKPCTIELPDASGGPAKMHFASGAFPVS